MGLLDKLKNKKENNSKENNSKENYNKMQKQELLDEITYTRNEDGSIQLDFYDRQADFKQFYDTTRLIINGQRTLANKLVYDCKVSWYGNSDAIMISGGEEFGRRAEYKDILAQLDINLLLSDENYCSAVMKKLLNQKRVTEYLNRGLEDNPQNPCGKYVGAIFKTPDQGYKKFFDLQIGLASHYSGEMVNKRQQLKELKEYQRQQSIYNKRMQMAKLQEEIDELEK